MNRNKKVRKIAPLVIEPDVTSKLALPSGSASPPVLWASRRKTGVGDMPRHFPSKSDYRRYVKKCHDRNKIIPSHSKGCSYVPSNGTFHPTIDTEKDYFNDKYQNVVRGYQNLVTKELYRGWSQEEWRYSYYQGIKLIQNFSKMCEQFENTTISNEMGDNDVSMEFLNAGKSTNLAEISDPFGHNFVYADLEPVKGNVSVDPFDFKVLHFSENGQVNSFLDYIIKG